MGEWIQHGWAQEGQIFLQCCDQSNGSSCVVPWQTHDRYVHGFMPFTAKSVEAMAEDRAAAASKSHSQAEKRRRERINSHLSTLRRLIPRSDKMDKAALLGSVVDHVKELKKKAIEINNVLTIPSEVDEVSVDAAANADPNNNSNTFLKASVCCDDRPELLADLIGAIKGLKLRAVRAELATLGGRVVNVMILCCDGVEDSNSNSNSRGVCLSSLKHSLKVALTRVASSSMASSSTSLSSKRQRMLLPSHNCSHFSG
ncbi:hypothetical protein Syun_000229 [Stephania yunnanensis]|uniref:BHLH domain-containing protein n=1 Tax=Stephania yunnanensis TaxID=152371 RepID=A0AAP0LFJ2_9MAGN